MQFPHNEKELASIFKNASLPQMADLEGEYYVDMLTGALPSLRRFSHRKVFIPGSEKTTGCNIVFKNFSWGNFYLEQGKAKDENNNQLDVVVINYKHPKNSFLTNKIRDQIRCVERGKIYLGRFNYLIGGKLKFLGYFSLSKKN